MSATFAFLRHSAACSLLAMLISCVAASAARAQDEPGGVPDTETSAEAFAFDLFTGAATYDIPIIVPPGLAGSEPHVVLRYDSGSVDKLKKREQAQPTGLGWTLDVGGYIFRDAKATADGSDDKFYLVLDGVKHRLVQVNATSRIWHTQDETFWRIQRNPSGTGDEWMLTTKDGARYRFGVTANSRFVGIKPDGGSVLTYKWFLSHSLTPAGVEAQYTYDKRQATVGFIVPLTYDRAVYPKTIAYSRYNGAFVGPSREVLFTLEPRQDFTNNGTTSTVSYHMDWRIKQIDVKLGGVLLRTYALTYDYSIDRDPTYTWGGGQAGDLTLRSVTEYGSNGSALPPTTFDYQDAVLSRAVMPTGGSVAFTYDLFETQAIYSNFAGEHTVAKAPAGTSVLLGHVAKTPVAMDWLGTPTLYAGCVSGGATCIDYGVRNTPDSLGLSTILGYLFGIENPQGSVLLYSAELCDQLNDDRGTVVCDLGGTTSPGPTSSPVKVARIFKHRIYRHRVVARDVDDGRGGLSTHTFEYGTPGVSSDDEDFRGHSWAVVTDPLGNTTRLAFHQDDARKGRVLQRLIRNAAGMPFKQVDLTWESKTNANFPGTTFAALTQRQVQDYDGDGTAKTRVESLYYDELGNVVRVEQHGDTSVSGDERTHVLEYAPNQTAWIVGLPSYRATKSGIGLTGVNLRQTWFHYDGAPTHTTAPQKGNLTKRCEWLDGGTNPCVSWAYDAYGNPTQFADARGNPPAAMTYDATYATFPRTVTSPPTANAPGGLVTTLTFDAGLGAPLDRTDANGRTTQYRYDEFGRLTAVIDPLGRTTTTSYDAWGVVGQQRVTTRAPDGSLDGLWREDYLDGLERVFEVRHESANATRPSIESTEYDSRGFVARRSLPYFPGETVYWTDFTYDTLGRISLTTFPDTRTETFTYNDWTTTVTDRGGRLRSYTDNAYGHTVRVVEPGSPGPVTSYEYDLLGHLRTVTDAAGTVVTQVAYDTLGRRTQLVDGDLGNWAYAYDANGNLTRRTDAKGQTLTFLYDALDRLTEKRYPGGRVVRNTYDLNPDGKGRLTRSEDVSTTGTVTSAIAYAYDELGREKSTTRQIDGYSYTTQGTYTPFGAPETLTYPDGEVLSYSYDAGGQVRRVVGTQDAITRTYVSSLLYDAALLPTQITYGVGGVTNDRGYHAPTLRLSRLRSYTSTTVLQDLGYEHDAVDNVTVIYDNLAVPARSRDQKFTYDVLDRLTRAEGPYGIKTYSYNAIGNILTKEGVTYSYGATAQTCNRLMPHAVTATSDGLSYRYDCNGNLVDDVERTFVWDPDDRPTSITRAGTDTTSFVYNSAGERIKKLSPSGVITRYAGNFEDRPGENVTVKHVFAGGRRVATRVTGPVAHAGTYIPLGDHLGSLHVLVSSSGASLQKLEYLPFGETYLNSGTADFDQYRFTGQERDPETGLYYYKARYYNPKLGRFISADPLVSDLYEPQDLNPFSYARNNPVRYTDPTGRFCCGTGASEVPSVDRGNEVPGLDQGRRSEVPSTDQGRRREMPDLNEGRGYEVPSIGSAGNEVPDTRSVRSEVPGFEGWQFREVPSTRLGVDVGSLVQMGLLVGARALMTSANSFDPAVGKFDPLAKLLGRLFSRSPSPSKAPPKAPPRFVVDNKIRPQLAPRGWTEDMIQKTMSNPTRTGRSWDRTVAPPERARVYADETGHHVVVNERTGNVVQVSNRSDPGWKADRDIVWD